MHPAQKFIKGFTLIEIVVVLGILGILIAAIFTLVSASYETISFTKARTSALSIATERMETLRNLPYSELGTIDGIPSGNLPQNEYTIRNGQKYDIKLTIIYIDDPYDGLAPDDTLPTDYKRARIEVNWGGISSSEKSPVSLISDISPRGLETSAGGGTLSISVFDSLALPVSQANVNIIADSLTPKINLELQTDDGGKVILPGTPACESCYKIIVTKDGYSTDSTYSLIEIANPAKPDASVIENELTQTSFAIDKVSNLTIKSFGPRSENFPSLPNINFTLSGQKIIGTDTEDMPILKYSNEFTTDSSGEIIINDIEWDKYSIYITGSSYNLSGTNPLLPINILPNTENDLFFATEPYSTNNYLLSFVDSAGYSIPTIYASLEKESETLTFPSGTEENPDFGHVFFPSLEEATYNLTATASGYLTHSSEVNILGNTYEKIIMNKE